MGEKREIEEIFSKAVRAGRRTYFFDVRSTRAGDYYLTMTESKRDFNEDGTPFYRKHKIYLYKEDFINFKEALNEMTDYIIKEKGEDIISLEKSENTEVKNEVTEENLEEGKQEATNNFTEVNFDDLGGQQSESTDEETTKKKDEDLE
ncbi:MAG: hypothetical protein CBC83_01615 [Flavobacteriales bacterium TMED123]|nr:MAG: hypothetical protein CBC83_01615 [Flavobacteriales bacterium TMED123]|tara:strand:+ start:1058 stop:1501 length:444 start_codon:yes stop_codon:yes gene_type:complete